MPSVLEIFESDKIKEEGRKFFAANEDARFVHRLDVILLICDNHNISKTSALYNINPSTIQRWIHRVNSEGVEGLRDRSGRGRCSRLREEDRCALKRDIEKSPSYFGYEQARWDGKLLSYHLKIRYGVELKVRQCQNLFKELGFSLQRPRKVPVGADADKREAFKKNSR